MDADGLRSLRNAYYLQFYPQVLKEAKTIEQQNKELATQAQIFYYRALAAYQPQEVFKLINSTTASTALQAIKQLAQYRVSSEQMSRDMVMDSINQWLSDEQMSKDITLQLISAQLFVSQGNYKDALKLVVDNNDHLEKLAMQVQIYLKIDRLDLAGKSVKHMQDIDDDDALTQLATAWLGIAQGGDKVQEALSLLDELQEKFGPSIPVLNSIAVCEIMQKNYTNALSHLKQARDLAISGNSKVCSETLVNSIIALQHVRKPADIIQRVVSELKGVNPDDEWLRKQAEMEALFDKHASSYKFNK